MIQKLRIINLVIGEQAEITVTAIGTTAAETCVARLQGERV